MKVARIQHYQELFLRHVEKHGLRGHLYRYECQSNWQKHWDLEALDLSSSYDTALTSIISARLWGGSKNSAKESMIAMIGGNKEFMRSAFRDLFAIEKDLGLRCDRFLFYCDEALNTVKSKEIIDHYHNRSMLCTYLAFEYPEKYALFDYPTFEVMMRRLESRNIPSIHEVERYQKSMFAIHSVLLKNEQWISTLQKIIGTDYIEKSLMIMADFAEFVATVEE